MTAAHTASIVATEGLLAGEAIWTAVEISGLRACDELEQFGIIVDQLADARPGTDAENALWHASAMKAVPLVLVGLAGDTLRRSVADNAWGAYVRELETDAQADADDFRFQQMRDERIAAWADVPRDDANPFADARDAVTKAVDAA